MARPLLSIINCWNRFRVASPTSIEGGNMTLRLVPTLFFAVLVATMTAVSASAAEPDPAVLSFKLPADLQWRESPTSPGLANAVLYGDPNKPGPYAVRNRFLPGAFSRPHYHPNDRFILVLSGT